MLTWAAYRRNHPGVLANWAQAPAGRQPSCTCLPCRADAAADAAADLELAGRHSQALLATADAATAGGGGDIYNAALASVLAAGRGVALYTVLDQMRRDGRNTDADTVEHTLARAIVAVARHRPDVMAELLSILHRATITDPPTRPEGNPT